MNVRPGDAVLAVVIDPRSSLRTLRWVTVEDVLRDDLAIVRDSDGQRHLIGPDAIRMV